MYGGDIALTPEQQATLEATSNQRSPFSIHNAVVKSVQYLWKNGTLFYTFDDSLGEFSKYRELLHSLMPKTHNYCSTGV